MSSARYLTQLFLAYPPLLEQGGKFISSQRCHSAPFLGRMWQKLPDIGNYRQRKSLYLQNYAHQPMKIALERCYLLRTEEYCVSLIRATRRKCSPSPKTASPSPRSWLMNGARLTIKASYRRGMPPMELRRSADLRCIYNELNQRIFYPIC